jgi:hypothetical protein
MRLARFAQPLPARWPLDRAEFERRAVAEAVVGEIDAADLRESIAIILKFLLREGANPLWLRGDAIDGGYRFLSTS